MSSLHQLHNPLKRRSTFCLKMHEYDTHEYECLKDPYNLRIERGSVAQWSVTGSGVSKTWLKSLICHLLTLDKSHYCSDLWFPHL